VDIWLEARHKIQRRKNKKKNQPHIQPHLHRVLRRPQVPLKLKTARRLWSMALMMLQASFHQKPPRATEIHRQSPPVPTTNSSWECLGLVPRYPWRYQGGGGGAGGWGRGQGLWATWSRVPHELQVSAINLFQHEFNSHRARSSLHFTPLHCTSFPMRFTSFLWKERGADLAFIL